MNAPDPPHVHQAPSVDTARLYLPRPALAQCLRGHLVRDTRGLNLSEAERFSFFPATPYCTLTWYLEGDSLWVPDGPADHRRTPRVSCGGRILFSGPFTKPCVGWATGPLYAMMLGWMPQALTALMGIDPGAYVNQIVPAEQVLSADWLAWCVRVQQAEDDHARVALIEDTLDPLWQAVRPHTTPISQLMADWTGHLATRAATSGMGRSLRQAERRIKQWTGLPLRELKGMGKLEQAFYRTITAMEQGQAHWSDVADETGYADQSHLCRQTRRLTGFSPEDLRRRIAEDEAFWAYRVWGFQESPR